MYDRNAKIQRILTELRAVDSEYVRERITKFRSNILTFGRNIVDISQTYSQCRAFICLSICLLATCVKITERVSFESFNTDASVDKKELIKFWHSSASGSGSRNCLRILQH